MVDHEAAVRTKFLALRPVLDERLSRLWAGAEAEALGDGGIAIVERATGLSRTTIRAGRDELRAGVSAEDVVLVRRAGGGRPRIEETTPEIVEVLESLVDPVTRGDPESPLRWTSKSTRKLATELTAQGYAVSPQKVGQLLAASGYSLQATQKTIEGTDHPDRDEQFAFINDRVDLFHGRGAPVISVDTKKKELVGAFANGGREWQPSGDPVPVRVHDFLDPTLGKAIPYGVYDLAQNTGWVSVGIDHDTPAFAVESIARWWRYMGQADVSRRPRAAHHRRRRRQQQRARPPLESRVAALRRPHRLDDQRVAFSAGHVEVEQDRAPALLPHHRELARSSAHRSRDDRAAHWECPHGERLDREGEARYADLSTWRQSTRTPIWTTCS